MVLWVRDYSLLPQEGLHRRVWVRHGPQEQKDMGLASDLFGDDGHVAKLMRRLRTIQAGKGLVPGPRK